MRERIGASDDPAVRADAYRYVLFEKGKFESVSELDSAEHLHIDTVLSGKKGYCLSLSVMALAKAMTT